MKITDEMVEWVWNRTNDVSRKNVELVLERAAQYSALSAEPAVGVKVKALEWRPEPPYHVARVFGTLYAIEAWDGGATLSGVAGYRDFSNLEAAKSAAQSDYESRIMSALVMEGKDNG